MKKKTYKPKSNGVNISSYDDHLIFGTDFMKESHGKYWNSVTTSKFASETDFLILSLTDVHRIC